MNQNRTKIWSPGCHPSALHAVLGDGARHVLQDQVGLPMAQLENFKHQPTWEKTKTKGHKDDTTQLLLYVIAICGLLYRFTWFLLCRCRKTSQVSVSAWTFDVFSHVKDSLPATIKICLRPSLHLNLDSLKPHAHGVRKRGWSGKITTSHPCLVHSVLHAGHPEETTPSVLTTESTTLLGAVRRGPPFLSACWNCETSPDQALQFSTKYK
jgi:hypothetical protein